MIEGAPGHGEGHNSGEALNITAALAVKKIMEREKLPGTIRIWTGTAEELVGTKAYFIRAGLFKDVDVALFTHVGNDLAVSWGDRDRHRPRVGAVLVPRRDGPRGRRAVARPQRARRRGADGHRLELPPRASAAQQRSHYVITDGGDQPNVVPRTASVWYYFRETDYPKIKEMWKTGDDIAKAAAMMTGIELLPSKVLGSAWPQHFNKTIAETTCRQHPEGRPARRGARQTSSSPRRCRRSWKNASRGCVEGP